MVDRFDMEVLLEHMYAIEEVIEQIGPLLIAASPAREQIVQVLRRWSERDTSDPVEVRQAELADVLLQALEPRNGT